MNRFILITVIAIITVILLSIIKEPSSTALDPAKTSGAKAKERNRTLSPPLVEQDEFRFSPPPFQQEHASLQNNPKDELSEEALTLNDRTLPEREKLTLLHSIIWTYCKRTNDGLLPSGDNREITNGLLGDNPKSIAFLSMESPLIGPLGNLVDKWGSSYSFHLNSLSKYSIMSAGPDKIYYTEDDIVINPEFSRATDTELPDTE